MSTETTRVEISTIQCKNCRATLDESFNFCGRCGSRLRGGGPTVKMDTFSPSFAARSRLRKRRWLLLSSVLCLVMLLGIFAVITGSVQVFRPLQKATSQTKHPTGLVWFYDQRGQSDAVALHANALPPLPQGKIYVAWLMNPLRPDQILQMGVVKPDKDGTISFLSDEVASFNGNVRNLRLLYTQAVITMEESNLKDLRPTGPVVLRGRIDPQAFDDLSQLFVSAPYLPNQQALVGGLHAQMRELGRWTENLLNALAQKDRDGVRTDLLRMIYIFEGMNGTDVQQLGIPKQKNVLSAGDGVGLLSSSPSCTVNQHTCGYYDAMRTILESLQRRGMISSVSMAQVLTVLMNLEQQTQIIRKQTVQLLPFSSLDVQTVQSLLKLSAQVDDLLNGVDHNGDGSVDAVQGEAGAAQLYTYLHLVGSIKLT